MWSKVTLFDLVSKVGRNPKKHLSSSNFDGGNDGMVEGRDSFLDLRDIDNEENESNLEDDQEVEELKLYDVPPESIIIKRQAWGVIPIIYMPYKEVYLTNSQKQANVNGFVNIGFSCYMNVIFQFLVNTPGIKEYFLLDLHLNEMDRDISKPIPETITTRIGELVQVYHSHNDHVINPFRLIELISSQSNVFHPKMNQEDSHEFLLYILDKLATELNR